MGLKIRGGEGRAREKEKRFLSTLQQTPHNTLKLCQLRQKTNVVRQRDAVGNTLEGGWWWWVVEGSKLG